MQRGRPGLRGPQLSFGLLPGAPLRGLRLRICRYEKFPHGELFYYANFHLPMKLRQCQMALLVPYVSLLCYLIIKKTILFKQNEAFFIRDMYSHLAVCLPMIQPHCSNNQLTFFQRD